MSYDNNMQVIWEQVSSDNPKAPRMRISVEIDGKKYQAGLWAWEKKDGTFVLDKAGNKKYKGTLELDTYSQEQQAQGMAQAKAAAEPADFSGDDIPF